MEHIVILTLVIGGLGIALGIALGMYIASQVGSHIENSTQNSNLLDNMRKLDRQDIMDKRMEEDYPKDNPFLKRK